MSLSTFKFDLLSYYTYKNIQQFFRTNETRGNVVWYDLVKKRKKYNESQIKHFREGYRQDKKLVRSQFCQSVGLHSIHTRLTTGNMDQESEMSILLAMAFGYRVDGKTHILECLEIPRCDINSKSQKIIFDQLNKLDDVRECYDLLLDLYDRAEYFYLHCVSVFDVKYLGLIYYYIKDCFTPRDNNGDPIPMRKVEMEKKTIMMTPRQIMTPVNDRATPETLVKCLKGVQTKISSQKNLRGQSSALRSANVSKQDMTVYFFVQLLIALPEHLVLTVSEYTGNMATLSNLLVYYKRTIHFIDSKERPRYYTSEKYFNDYLVLWNKTIENQYNICYSIPVVDTLWKKFEQQVIVFKGHDNVKKYDMFRSAVEMGASYDYGLPDYSSPKTVWVVKTNVGVMGRSLHHMIGYFTCYWMWGSYISYKMMDNFELSPFEIMRVADDYHQEAIYQNFKADVKPEVDEEIPVMEFKRITKTKVPSNAEKEVSPFEEFDEQIIKRSTTVKTENTVKKNVEIPIPDAAELIQKQIIELQQKLEKEKLIVIEQKKEKQVPVETNKKVKYEKEIFLDDDDSAEVSENEEGYVSNDDDQEQSEEIDWVIKAPEKKGKGKI